MNKLTQINIAKRLKVSPSFVSQLINNKKRPSWERAKEIAKITNTKPILWLEGSSDEIKSALNNNQLSNSTL